MGDGGDGQIRRLSFHGDGNLPDRRPDSRLDLWAPEPREALAFNLAEYWGLLIKHRILVASVFAVSVVLGLVATLLTTPVYTASTTLQIDREAARIVTVDDVSPGEAATQGQEFFQTQYGLLRSRSLAARVVESLGLTRSESFLRTMKIDVPEASTPQRAAAERREAVLRAVQENTQVRPVLGSRLVSVSFESPDPALSARVANAYAENFIQSNLDRKFESSSYAREFLEERLQQTKTRLEAAERQLVAYAADQRVVNVGESASGDGSSDGTQSLSAGSLVSINQALSAARVSRVAAEEKWRQASASPATSLPEVLQNPVVQRLTAERAALSADYEQKLQIFRPESPQMQQLKAQLDETDRQIQTVADAVRNSIRQQYLVAVNEERSLQARVSALEGDVIDFRNRSIQYNILKREVDSTRTLYEGLLQRYKEVGVAGGVAANNISIVDRAEAPLKPSKPQMIPNLALAAAIGLGLGLLAAFLIEALDDSLATPEDVESKLGELVLGVVPELKKEVTPVEALKDIRSGFAEAYYSLRTSLQFSTANGAPKTILVTSSRPGEGKSTTALALARGFAQIGQRVLLVDADLRNPSMHRLLGVGYPRGLSSLLSGAVDFDQAVQETSDSNLAFMPCGPLPPNPAELLTGVRVSAFLDRAARAFDIVVIDGPPVLGFADSPGLAAKVAGTLFVVESRGSRRGQVRGALRRLSVGDAKILGVVLTKFAAPSAQYGGYDYAYDYDYGLAEPEAPKKKAAAR